MSSLSKLQILRFRESIYDYFYLYGRHDLPWRQTENPYYILISEIMLQQTQVTRILNKYESFIKRFPKIENLDRARLKSVLRLWSGLGYNRRALALKKSVRIICKENKGIVPDSYEKLIALPGIGPTTANEILTFAFNKSSIIIETNIRTVYIHFFFAGKDIVSDKDIIPLIEQTLDTSNPRIWYYALMDYGVMLKKKYDNPSKRSIHYVKQSKFEGSHRQARGIMLKILTKSACSMKELAKETNLTNSTILSVLSQLQEEGFIKKMNKKYMII